MDAGCLSVGSRFVDMRNNNLDQLTNTVKNLAFQSRIDTLIAGYWPETNSHVIVN